MKISETQMKAAIDSMSRAPKDNSAKAPKAGKTDFAGLMSKELSQKIGKMDEVRLDRINEAQETVASIKKDKLPSQDIAGKLIGRSLVDKLA